MFCDLHTQGCCNSWWNHYPTHPKRWRHVITCNYISIDINSIIIGFARNGQRISISHLASAFLSFTYLSAGNMGELHKMLIHWIDWMVAKANGWLFCELNSKYLWIESTCPILHHCTDTIVYAEFDGIHTSNKMNKSANLCALKIS